MGKFLIVLAHPEASSLCGSLKSTAEETLRDQGHEVKVSDLYAMKFNPVVSEDIWTHDPSRPLNIVMENVNASNKSTFRRDIAEEHEKIQWADYIILISPVWWGSINAMLTGYMDVVFCAGVAWGFQNMFDKGLLRGKKAFFAVTASVKEEEYAPGKFSDMSIESLIFGKTKGTLYFCGLEVLPTFAIYDAVMGSEEHRKACLKKWTDMLSNVDSVEPMFKY